MLRYDTRKFLRRIVLRSQVAVLIRTHGGFPITASKPPDHPACPLGWLPDRTRKFLGMQDANGRSWIAPPANRSTSSRSHGSTEYGLRSIRRNTSSVIGYGSLFVFFQASAAHHESAQNFPFKYPPERTASSYSRSFSRTPSMLSSTNCREQSALGKIAKPFPRLQLLIEEALAAATLLTI